MEGILTDDFTKFLHDGLDSLEQFSSLDEFYEQFETMRSLISYAQPWIPEAYFASRFVYGLHKHIQPYVLRFSPLTVLDAFHLACIYEYNFSNLLVTDDKGTYDVDAKINKVSINIEVVNHLNTCDDNVEINITQPHQVHNKVLVHRIDKDQEEVLVHNVSDDLIHSLNGSELNQVVGDIAAETAGGNDTLSSIYDSWLPSSYVHWKAMEVSARMFHHGTFVWEPGPSYSAVEMAHTRELDDKKTSNHCMYKFSVAKADDIYQKCTGVVFEPGGQAWQCPDGEMSLTCREKFYNTPWRIICLRVHSIIQKSCIVMPMKVLLRAAEMIISMELSSRDVYWISPVKSFILPHDTSFPELRVDNIDMVYILSGSFRKPLSEYDKRSDVRGHVFGKLSLAHTSAADTIEEYPLIVYLSAFQWVVLEMIFSRTCSTIFDPGITHRLLCALEGNLLGSLSRLLAASTTEYSWPAASTSTLVVTIVPLENTTLDNEDNKSFSVRGSTLSQDISHLDEEVDATFLLHCPLSISAVTSWACSPCFDVNALQLVVLQVDQSPILTKARDVDWIFETNLQCVVTINIMMDGCKSWNNRVRGSHKHLKSVLRQSLDTYVCSVWDYYSYLTRGGPGPIIIQPHGFSDLVIRWRCSFILTGSSYHPCSQLAKVTTVTVTTKTEYIEIICGLLEVSLLRKTLQLHVRHTDQQLITWVVNGNHTTLVHVKFLYKRRYDILQQVLTFNKLSMLWIILHHYTSCMSILVMHLLTMLQVFVASFTRQLHGEVALHLLWVCSSAVAVCFSDDTICQGLSERVFEQGGQSADTSLLVSGLINSVSCLWLDAWPKGSVLLSSYYVVNADNKGSLKRCFYYILLVGVSKASIPSPQCFNTNVRHNPAHPIAFLKEYDQTRNISGVLSFWHKLLENSLIILILQQEKIRSEYCGSSNFAKVLVYGDNVAIQTVSTIPSQAIRKLHVRQFCSGHSHSHRSNLYHGLGSFGIIMWFTWVCRAFGCFVYECFVLYLYWMKILVLLLGVTVISTGKKTSFLVSTNARKGKRLAVTIIMQGRRGFYLNPSHD